MNPYKLATWHERRVIDNEGHSVDAAEVLAHANDLRSQRDALLAALESIERRIGGDMAAIEAGEVSADYTVSMLCQMQDEARAAIAAARGEG